MRAFLRMADGKGQGRTIKADGKELPLGARVSAGVYGVSSAKLRGQRRLVELVAARVSPTAFEFEARLRRHPFSISLFAAATASARLHTRGRHRTISAPRR
jgi:hypothetical protein